jgi:hypothetical protein
MKHRLAHYLLVLLPLTGIAHGQHTDGTVASQAASTTGAGIDTAAEKAGFRSAIGLPIRVTDFGAVGDGMVLHDAAITNGDATVTSATATFPADIAGKYCRVAGGTTAGVHQVETATAAGTITGSGTISVTITGDGIDGSPLTVGVHVVAGDTAATWAGKVRNHLANSLQLFDRYDAGGSSTSIELTGKRPRANDTTLNIALANGTCTGVTTATTSANTTQGVATVDLITTVASRNSATSIELSNAPGRTASGVTILYGTNDTAAIQSAIDAAASSTYTREVIFPRGRFLCNLDGKPHVSLTGADGGMTKFEYDPPGPLPDLTDSERLTTILLPAVATEPVIGYTTADKIYSARISRIGIFGTKEQVGYGIQLGEPDESNNGFTGGSLKLEQVMVTGFEYALSSSRVAALQCDTSLFLYSRVCVFLGETNLGIGPTDTSIFNNCGTGGANCDANWFISASKGITITGGDHNDGAHVAIVCNGATVAMTGVNSESTTRSPFVVATGRLNVTGSNILHMNGPLVDAIGSDSNVTITETRIGAVGAGALWQGKAVYCRTDQSSGHLDKLPRGGVIARYPDLGLNDLQVTEYTTEIYTLPVVAERRSTVSDEFIGHYAASPYSALGWTLTTLAGDAPVVYLPTQPAYPGNVFGLAGIGTSTSNSANVLRFAVPVESFNPTAGYWRARWRLALGASSTIRFRCGFYSLDTAAAGVFTPKNGIGIRVDRSVPDSNIQFEVINNETVTAVDTGIPYTALNSAREIQIWRTAEGLFFGLYPTLPNGAAITYPMVEHPSTGTVNELPARSLLREGLRGRLQLTPHPPFAAPLSCARSSIATRSPPISTKRTARHGGRNTSHRTP